MRREVQKRHIAPMSVGQENGQDIGLFFEAHGSGQPVVLTPGTRSGIPIEPAGPTSRRTLKPCAADPP
jgi:hypothetical protein